MKIALALLIACVGCNIPKPRTNADYVREHHCTTDGKLHVSSATIIVLDGEAQSVGGDTVPFRWYDCPDGTAARIHTNEDQP